LFRRRGRRVTLSEKPPPPKPEPVRRPAEVARMLALARHLQSAIDRAAVARKLGLTRALSSEGSSTAIRAWSRGHHGIVPNVA
jgi:hypothetical protein